MANVLVCHTQAFNIFDNMGQSISQGLPTNSSDNNIYNDDKEVPSLARNAQKQDGILHSNAISKKELPTSASMPSSCSTTNACSGAQGEQEDDMVRSNTNNNTSLETDTYDEPTDKYEELLCAGETLDDMVQVNIDKQVNTVNKNGAELGNYIDGPQDIDAKEPERVSNGSSNAAMDWSEKKWQFSMSKRIQSGESLSSDVSLESRHSVSSYLHAREYDAEEILTRLGFGCQSSIDIPDRFLANNNLASSITFIEQATIVAACDDVFASGVTSTRTSVESSWSDSSFGRLPSRFTSSLSSLSSLSEPEEDTNTAVIPCIIEPVKEQQDDGFDLMRHLRLNRLHNDKGFLEPVTEELEVSSVGSGSAQTRVAAQQDSFESIGSVATKISLHKSESDDTMVPKGQHDVIAPIAKDILHIDKTESPKCLEHGNKQLNEENKQLFTVPSTTLNNEAENSEKSTEVKPDSESNGNTRNDFHAAASTQNNLESKPQNIRPLSLKPFLSLQLPQESFELEEIATSEENLDKIEEKSPRNYKRRELLKRDNSDDSSGFGDDAMEGIAKNSPPKNVQVTRHDISKEHILHSPDHQDRKYSSVPMSTPKDNAASKRSSFAKRQSWSTTKQKRVIFEEETLQKCRSFDDLQSKRKRLDFESRSLDSSFPGYSDSRHKTQNSNNSQSKYFPNRSIDVPSKRSSRVSVESDQDMKGGISDPKNQPLISKKHRTVSKSNSLDISVEDKSLNSRQHRVVSKSHSVDFSRGKGLSNSNSSNRSVVDDSSSRKVDFKSHSLDIPLAALSENDTSNVPLSLSPGKIGNSPAMEVHSEAHGLSQRQGTLSENKAISNIKEFMSNLWSLRSTIKKASLKSKEENSRTDIISETERLPDSNSDMLEPHPVESNEQNIAHGTEESPDVTQRSLVKLNERVPCIAVGVSQHKSILAELSAFKEDLQKYYSSFISMDAISTSQDRYYTRKLQARFAWDILFIRRLRSYIKEELDEIQSKLEYRTTLPRNIDSQMSNLLRLQSGLREYLSSLANTVTPRFSLEMQPAKSTIPSLDIAPSTLAQMEENIRGSVVQEIKSTFELQLSELRQEMRGKDSLIEELLKRIPKT